MRCEVTASTASTRRSACDVWLLITRRRLVAVGTYLGHLLVRRKRDDVLAGSGGWA